MVFRAGDADADWPFFILFNKIESDSIDCIAEYVRFSKVMSRPIFMVETRPPKTRDSAALLIQTHLTKIQHAYR